MKKLIKKLRSRLKGKGGETLAEVLVAMLIAALALTMLASVISTASDMIQRSKTTTEAYYSQNNLLEQQPATTDTLSITVVFENRKDISGKNITVKLKTGGGAMTAYRYENNGLSGMSVISYKKG